MNYISRAHPLKTCEANLRLCGKEGLDPDFDASGYAGFRSRREILTSSLDLSLGRYIIRLTEEAKNTRHIYL